jgi:ribonuclease HII|eukprot:30003-Pelagococcus_subviridis.AAC.2
MLARALGASSVLARLASTPARSVHASNMMKFVKKGVVMADAPFEPPPKQSPSSRSSTRKRTTKAEKDAELAKKAAKKPKKNGPSRAHEQMYWDQGKKIVCGVDEAGRGPLAGPVVAAACVFPEDLVIDAINDSKQMTEEDREEVYEQLMENPEVLKSVCVIDHKEIDDINILEATMKAMRKSVEGLPTKADWVLVDGNRVPEPLKGRAEAIVKGDAKSVCIAAASVLAKVTRDRMMVEIAKEHPEYGFAEHKGYGVKSHMAAIHEHGPCPYHRMTFAPMKYMPGGSAYDGDGK